MNFNYFLDNQYLKESIDFNIDNELVKEVLVKACKKINFKIDACGGSVSKGKLIAKAFTDSKIKESFVSIEY